MNSEKADEFVHPFTDPADVPGHGGAVLADGGRPPSGLLPLLIRQGLRLLVSSVFESGLPWPSPFWRTFGASKSDILPICRIAVRLFQPAVDGHLAEPPMAADLLARDLAFSNELAERRLRYLQVGRQLVDGQESPGFSSIGSTSPAARQAARHCASSCRRSLQLVTTGVTRLAARRPWPSPFWRAFGASNPALRPDAAPGPGVADAGVPGGPPE